MLHDAIQHRYGTLFAARNIPKLGAVVEIHACLHAGRAGGLQGFAGHLGGCGAQPGRDAGDVEPLDARENLGPGDRAGLQGGDGRAFAVVEDAAGARRGAEFEEIQADAVFVGPHDVLGGYAGLAGLVGDQPAEWIVGQPRHPGGPPAEAGERDCGVELGAADLQVEAVRLLEAAKCGRGETDHRLAERDHFMGHVKARA